MTAIEILRNEHALILQMLALLEHHLRQVAAGAALDREFARWVVDFSREFADDTHHAKEEGVLFGWLESRGLSRASGPLGAMLVDHQRCRSQAQDMAGALARADVAAFAALAGELAQVLRRHMASEGENLFRLAEQLMTPAEDVAAVQAFGRVVREREGALVRSRHLAAIERWRRSFGLPPF
jgi:hemerythrin-like domain-containing protein